MRSEEEQKKEQAEITRCHAHLHQFIIDTIDDNVGLPVLIFVIEQELHRLRGLIYAQSVVHSAEADIKGMYR